MLRRENRDRANQDVKQSRPEMPPLKAGVYYVKPYPDTFEVKRTDKGNSVRKCGAQVLLGIVKVPIDGKDDPDLHDEQGPLRTPLVKNWFQVNDVKQPKPKRLREFEGVEGAMVDPEDPSWVVDTSVPYKNGEYPASGMERLITVLRSFPHFKDKGDALFDEVVEMQDRHGITEEMEATCKITEELDAYYQEFGTWFRDRLLEVAGEDAEPGLVEIGVSPPSGNFPANLTFRAIGYDSLHEKIVSGIGARFNWKAQEKTWFEAAAEGRSSKPAEGTTTESTPVEDNDEDYDD